MSNGILNKDLRKCKQLTNKSNKIKSKGLKNSTTNNNSSVSSSCANPFIFEKKIDVWLTDEGQLYLESWANDGLTDEEICRKMNISVSTLWRWCNAEEKIKKAIMRGRDMSTIEVENTLYKCARGFEYQEEQVTKDGGVVVVTRYQPPSIEAQKYILSNRRRDKWKSKQEVALEAQIAAQAEVKTETKIITAEDVAKSLMEDDLDIDLPVGEDEVTNG